MKHKLNAVGFDRLIYFCAKIIKIDDGCSFYS